MNFSSTPDTQTRELYFVISQVMGIAYFDIMSRDWHWDYTVALG